MKLFIAIALVVIVDIANAMIKKQTYDRWASVMDELGYGWQAHPVTTDDGYKLTLFRIMGDVEIYEDKPPILIVHGL